MTASGIPALIDQLVVIANAAFPDATSPVQVCDGPSCSQEDTGQQLWIGVTNPNDPSSGAASADQQWPYAASAFRREELTVHCMALAWSNDGDFKTIRDQAFAQMAAFSAAIVADPTLSGAVLMGRSIGSNVRFDQGFNQQNAPEAVVAFDVTAMQQFQN